MIDAALGAIRGVRHPLASQNKGGPVDKGEPLHSMTAL